MNLNPLSALSNAVETACDVILPDKLEFIGDLAGLATDLRSGNWLKCVDDFQDFAADLPQQLAELLNRPGTRGEAPGETATSCLEPTPPPAYGTPATEETDATVPSSARNTTVGRNTDGGTPVPRRTGFGAPPTAEKGPNAVDAPVVRATAVAAETGDTTAAAKVKVTKSMSADSFFSMSDKAMMDAVRDGKIPESVSKDPDQMRRLQVRMQDAAQMNQLITMMLTALHEMNKQVIQNLRV